MTPRLKFILVLAAVFLCACATTHEDKLTEFKDSRGTVSVLLMPMDVEVVFAKLGSKDLRADWTKTARENLKTALSEHLKKTGEKVLFLSPSEKNSPNIRQLILLESHVSQAIVSHVVRVDGNYKGVLPHKKDNPLHGYTIGPEARKLKEKTGADYAAFLKNRTVVESGTALATKAALFALSGQLSMPSGIKGTYISLVDLNTGEVVWLNANLTTTLAGTDARNPKNAKSLVKRLMDNGPFIDEKTNK